MTRSVIALAIICQVICLNEAQNALSSWAALFADSPAMCKSGQIGRICKDCKTVAVCDNNGEELVNFPCTLVSGDSKKEFCTGDGICVDYDTCGLPGQVDKVECPNYAGFFPSPMKCNEFYFCDGVQREATPYTCSSKARFDRNNKVCSGAITTCQTYSSEQGGLCFNKPLQTLIVASDASSYVICPPKGSPTKLKICPNENEKFDLKTLSCIFSCPKEGFFPNSDVKKYIECVKEGTMIQKYTRDCQTNTEFDPKTGFCSGGPNVLPPEDGSQEQRSDKIKKD